MRKREKQMKIIARKSCSGKTKELIKIAIDENIPILCFSESQARSIQEKSQFYFGSVAPICTVYDVLEGEVDIPYVLIDNMDRALEWFMGEFTNYETKIAATTLSTEN
jgi:hypothetical protein